MCVRNVRWHVHVIRLLTRGGFTYRNAMAAVSCMGNRILWYLNSNVCISNEKDFRMPEHYFILRTVYAHLLCAVLDRFIVWIKHDSYKRIMR
jgi:hypothetical protein